MPLKSNIKSHQKTVLAIGIKDIPCTVEQLPVRLIMAEGADQALKYLKTETIDAVLCRWQLHDMLEGLLIKRIIEAKPSMPVIALVDACSPRQEISARTLGVSMVLPDDIGPEAFGQALSELLGVAKCNQ